MPKDLNLTGLSRVIAETLRTFDEERLGHFTAGIVQAEVQNFLHQMSDRSVKKSADYTRELRVAMASRQPEPIKINGTVIVPHDPLALCQIATDGSVVRDRVGSAFVASNGAYSLRCDIADSWWAPHAVVVAELRAVAMALARMRPVTPVEVQVDSEHALSVLRAWTDDPRWRPPYWAQLPPYVCELPSLLSQRVAPTWLTKVAAHRGLPFNECADAMSKLMSRGWSDKAHCAVMAHDWVSILLASQPGEGA